MLTKDLLIHRKVKGKIIPKSLDPEDGHTLKLASDLVTIMQNAQGKTLLQLEEEFEGVSAKNPKIKAGFIKLPIDRCELDELNDEAETARWEMILKAQELREKSTQKISILEFQNSIAAEFDKDFLKLSETIYSDLPDYRKINSVADYTPELLIHRYNTAQIQGLILSASRVTMTLLDLDLTTKRALFRSLKFHSLLIDEVTEKKGSLSFTLSGPMSLFEASQSYGLKMANFFPYLLLLPKFKLAAEIRLSGETYELSVDEKCEIKSHYKDFTGYTPSEFKLCIDTFNEKFAPSSLSASDEFLNLGAQCYSFPDLTLLQDPKGEHIYIELFHRWHSGQIKQRISTLQKLNIKELKIGVCRSLSKKQEFKEFLSENGWFKEHGFEFTDFPTAKQIHRLINS